MRDQATVYNAWWDCHGQFVIIRTIIPFYVCVRLFFWNLPLFSFICLEFTSFFFDSWTRAWFFTLFSNQLNLLQEKEINFSLNHS